MRYRNKFTEFSSSVSISQNVLDQELVIIAPLPVLCRLLTQIPGTPHNGSSIATCGKIIANIVAACSPLNPARGLLSSLQKDSQVLFEITEEFLEKAPELQLISFFEMETTNFVFFRRMVSEAQR